MTPRMIATLALVLALGTGLGACTKVYTEEDLAAEEEAMNESADIEAARDQKIGEQLGGANREAMREEDEYQDDRSGG